MSGVRQFSRVTICRPGDICKRITGGIALVITLSGSAAALAEEQNQALSNVPPATESRSAPGATELNPATGRIAWLGTDQDKFLTIYTEATAPAPLGAAIILPGIGTHPDWPGIVTTLRSELPKLGWTTLSLQFPETPATQDEMANMNTRFDAAQNRIQAGIKYCQEHGIRNIALIGHGLGAAMAAVYLVNHKDSGITAFTAVSMYLPNRANSDYYRPELLQQIALPILDIYGSRDQAEVRAEADARAIAAKKRNIGAASTQGSAGSYRQYAMVGAEHFYRGYERDLVKRISGWLKRHTGATQTTPLAGPA